MEFILNVPILFISLERFQFKLTNINNYLITYFNLELQIGTLNKLLTLNMPKYEHDLSNILILWL